MPALIIFRHSGKLTCSRYQDSPLPKTSNWVEKFTKFGQLILSKIIKIALGNLRASPPLLFGRGGDRSHESALMTESHLAWERKFLELSYPGAKVPWSESSWNFPGAKVPGTFAPGSESSRERKFQGAKVPYHDTFAPGSESS